MLAQNKTHPEAWKGVKAKKAIATVVKRLGNTIVHKVNYVFVEKKFLILFLKIRRRSNTTLAAR